ncbi:MAG TPA: hypothetical protein DD979_05955 [Gammaproteobacteria bacterium]|jgi:hypothetical protein|nr:hypothetical protein [Gammaproteobacteria bacterium]
MKIEPKYKAGLALLLMLGILAGFGGVHGKKPFSERDAFGTDTDPQPDEGDSPKTLPGETPSQSLIA